MPQYYNEDNLLKYFQDEIIKASQKKLETLREEILHLRNNEMNRIETEVKDSLYFSLGAELREIEDQEIQAVNQLNSELLNRLTHFRDGLVEEIFTVVNTKIHDFTKTPKYTSWVENKIKAYGEQLENTKIVFTIGTEDKLLKKALLNLVKNAEVHESPLIKLGGFRLMVPENRLEYDETFDSKLNEKRQWFFENSKLFVR